MSDTAVLRTPSRAYADGAAAGRWHDDPAQHPALRELDRIQRELLAATPTGLLARFGVGTRAAPVRGLYLWGGVGRGKTFLVDLFYASLPLAQKRRTHFHRFMRGVHEQLRLHAGQSDPLANIARQWRGSLRVLVLDEFFVTDIGDAMLLGRLLERLFAEGITLVTTSNTAPQNLYKDGLQRESFLPAIAQLRQHCVELAADGRQDYRLRALTRSPVYRQPLDAGSDAWLGERWQALAPAVEVRQGSIEIEGRRIAVRARGHGAAWFDFAQLCEGPRSTDDYIEIAREFGIILLGGIPVFDANNEDAARRFVNLVDEFYDRQVTLVCTAATPAVSLYRGTRLAGAFERTASRLIEMQSAEYLARAHRG